VLGLLAPNIDWQFIKDIIVYEVIDVQISKLALKKLCGYLWYLTPKATSLAFFDDTVSLQTKIKMVKTMQSRDSKLEANKRIILQQMNYTIMLIKTSMISYQSNLVFFLINLV